MRNNSFFIFVKDVPPHWSFRLPFEEYFFVIIIRFRTSQLHIITHALAFNNKNNSNDPRQAFGAEALWKLLRYIKIA